MGENNTVTIPTEEYRNLLEIQVRANILKDYTTGCSFRCIMSHFEIL